MTETYSKTLRQVIKMNQGSLQLSHNKYFAYNVAKGLAYLHAKGVLHRDLSTENVVVDENWKVKLSGFRSATVVTGQINVGSHLKSDITLRQNRAPEMLLKYKSTYGFPADMWSFGCLLAEVFSAAKPIFGVHKAEMKEKLVATLGLPSEEIQTEITNE